MELGETLPLVGTCVVGVLFILLVGYFYGRRSDKNVPKSSPPKNSEPTTQIKAENTSAAVNLATSKRIKHKKKREIHQEFTHSWIIGALKGHTSPILDINLSSNGKYLASCSEDNTGSEDQEYEFSELQTSSTDSAASNTSSPGKNQPLSRRQRKNRIRSESRGLSKMGRRRSQTEDQESEKSSSSSESGIGSQDSYAFRNGTQEEDSSDSCSSGGKDFEMEALLPVRLAHVVCPVECLVRSSRLHFISEKMLYESIHRMMLTEGELIHHGYPMFYEPEKIIFDPAQQSFIKQKELYNNNFMEPNKVYFKNWRPPPKNNEPEPTPEEEELPGVIKASDTCNNTYEIRWADKTETFDKVCMRCNEIGEFLTKKQRKEANIFEMCLHHPEPRMTQNGRICLRCKRAAETVGCKGITSHVWLGKLPGLNGPYTNFVRTKKRFGLPNYKIYSLDCEMCFTFNGLEITQVTMVDLHGKIVYNELVQATKEIIDFNTRFSGLHEKNYFPKKSFSEVQQDLCNLIDADTILVGHGLENDLRALRIVHTKIVDTSILFAEKMRASLRNLALTRLGKYIQVPCHDAAEDARTTLELVLRFIDGRI